MTPRTAALRYRIWAYASPKGWDVTFNEVADALDVSPQTVGSIVRDAKWLERFRSAESPKNHDCVGVGSFSASRAMAMDIASGRIGYAP